MEKRILLTGGAGFIGSAIIDHFQKMGLKDIYVIDNLSFGKRSTINIPDDHFFEIDIRNKDQLEMAIREIAPHKVIHLAAIHFIPYCNQHPFEASDVNIRGTINILEVLKDEKQLDLFFFASTAAVYPIFNQAITENHPLIPQDIYGLSKLAGEYLVREFHLSTGIPSIICRFFNAFGPNETNPHLIPEIQRQINTGSRTIKLGNLDPKRDFIHTYDMAFAVRALIEKFDTGIDVFNLGKGEEYSPKDIVDAFEKALGESIKIEQDPRRMRKSDRMHLLADVSKLRAFLNWEPKISIEEGTKSLINLEVNYE